MIYTLINYLKKIFYELLKFCKDDLAFIFERDYDEVKGGCRWKRGRDARRSGLEGLKRGGKQGGQGSKYPTSARYLQYHNSYIFITVFCLYR